MNTQARWLLVVGAGVVVGLILVACVALLVGSLGLCQMAGPIWGPVGLLPRQFRSIGRPFGLSEDVGVNDVCGY